MAIEEKKYLGSAGVGALVTWVAGQDDEHLQAAKDYADSLAENYDAAGTATTKVQELANGQVKTNTEHIGTMDNLETTAKGDLVSALNEVRNAVSAGGTAAAITMEEKTTELGEGVTKAYVLKQGENTVGTINIPKDMVVQSGEVVVDPAGQPAGTYIKLTLANATNDVIYVNVGTLVDIYKAKASATQVQIAIDSATREISASIVAGSVTATELADNAVTTVKIADGNVTKAKLATDVQASLDKADGAAEDATTKANAAQAAAEATAKAYTDTELNDIANELIGRIELVEGPVTETRIEDGAVSYDKLSDALQNNYLDKIADLEAKKHEHSNKTQLDTYDKTQAELLASAQTAAETYVNEAMSSHDEEYGILSNNVGDIKGRVEALEEANVQPDWNQNDSAAADYVKNRPFYKEGEETTFGEFSLANVYEGAQGWQYLNLEENIPSDVLSRADLKLEVDGSDVYSGNGYNAFDGVTIGDATGVRVSFEQSGKIGFYNAYGVDISSHTIRLFAGDMTIVQLDEKFIPATIARASDVDGVAGRVDAIDGDIAEMQEVDAGIIERVEALEEANVQADWNQNDPEAADYVKNRTHYDNSNAEYLIQDLPVTGMQSGSMGSGVLPYPDGATLTWEVGETYYLDFNGVTYTSDPAASDMIRFADPIPHPSGDPVVINLNVKADGIYGIGFYDGTSMYNGGFSWANSDLTFTLYSGTIDIKQLDEKFIPDTIARSSAVEGVAGRMTTAEGKIEALESVTYVEMTAEEVNALIAANTAN